LGEKYRVIRDPAQALRGNEFALSQDPWRVARRLAAVEGVELRQDGDDGCNFRFHVDRFDAVAEVMKPRRRRRLSPEQRAKCADRLAKHQFTPARERPQNDRTCVAAASGDS